MASQVRLPTAGITQRPIVVAAERSSHGRTRRRQARQAASADPHIVNLFAVARMMGSQRQEPKPVGGGEIAAAISPRARRGGGARRGQMGAPSLRAVLAGV